MTRIGFVQLAPELGETARNLDRICDLIAGAEPWDLLVLPELATSGYSLQQTGRAEELAEPIPGPSTERLARIAGERGGAVVLGLAERDGQRLYNSAALIDGGGVRALYRKGHLFWNEWDLFAPGDRPLPVTALGAARVGMMICFDWAFPDVAGTLARRGAQILAHPSNLVLPHAFAAMPIRCLENRVFAVTCNRWGSEPGPDGPVTFRGESLIVSPRGEVLARGPREGDAVEIVEIDPAQADDKRLTPRNDVIADRRRDLYGEE